jgi:hypothetical protein
MDDEKAATAVFTSTGTVMPATVVCETDRMATSTP